MAKTVQDAKLGSRSARATLKRRGQPYYKTIEPGLLHLGYRKGKGVCRWVVRRYIGKQQYEVTTLDGVPDDTLDADGGAVLNFPQAQEKARELFKARTANLRPAGPITVEQAVKNYVEYLRTHKRTADDAEVRLGLHVLPRLGGRRVAELTQDDIERWQSGLIKHDPDPEVVRRSKDGANRLMAYFRAALNRAFMNPHNHIPSDYAWRSVRPFKGVGRAREVHLDPAQCTRLINVCEGAFRNFVIAALLSGCWPPHELVALRVRDFDAGQGTLYVAGGKTGARKVWLTKEGVVFFDGISAGKGADDLLLPAPSGGAWAVNGHLRPMREAVRRAKLPAGTSAYSLRHTHASMALANGMNPQLLAENLGSSVKMIEVNYGKFHDSTRRQLIEQSSPKLGIKSDAKVRKLRAR